MQFPKINRKKSRKRSCLHGGKALKNPTECEMQEKNKELNILLGVCISFVAYLLDYYLADDKTDKQCSVNHIEC